MSAPSIHATLVALNGEGVLILGAAGSGKSDLALRLIDDGAALVADDRVIFFERGGQLYGRAPEKLRGLLEVRGAGIAHMKAVTSAPIRLAVVLTQRQKIDRLPDAKFHVLQGHGDQPLPALHPCGFDASAPARIRLALSQALRVRKEKMPREGAPGIWDMAADAVMVRARARKPATRAAGKKSRRKR